MIDLRKIIIEKMQSGVKISIYCAKCGKWIHIEDYEKDHIGHGVPSNMNIDDAFKDTGIPFFDKEAWAKYQDWDKMPEVDYP